MFYRSFSWSICILVPIAIAADSGESDFITDSGSDVTVYRVRTSHPLDEFRRDSAGIAANLEELIMTHDYKRRFLKTNMADSWMKTVEAGPYCDMSRKDLCKQNNGNCSHKCEMVGYQTVCSCHEGFTLTDGNICSEISGCNVILSGTSGKFDIAKADCQWTIKAPTNHIIEVSIAFPTYIQNYLGHGTIVGIVYDGNSTEAQIIDDIKIGPQEIVLRSTGPDMLIRSRWQRYWEQKSLHVSYVTGYYSLQSTYDNGYLEILLTSSSEKNICFSLTYSLPQYGTLEVSQEHEKKKYQLTPQFSFSNPERHWRRNIYQVPFYPERTSLKFHFSAAGSKVFNLGRCLNIENFPIGGAQGSDGGGTVCLNGGMWNYETQTCICPQGFTGVHCEEGCGPNRYGENCTMICSFLSSACKGMIFCTNEQCSCAPGFQGPNCDSSCNPTNYGASCQQYCGKCEGGEPCDRYTGKCYSGCASGFYPPFCQQTYKVLMNNPDIVAASYKSLKISLSFENVTGEGQPTFYEIQYKEENEELWSKLSPRIISDETEFEITGLLPGKYYETRIILIDEDGGSYQKDVPKSKALTKCTEPHEENYHFTVTDIHESGVVLNWSYEHDKNSLVCEIVEFELSVISGSEQLIFSIKENECTKTLFGLMPDMTYSFQLTGKTITGYRAEPTEITAHTLPAVPGRVRVAKAVSFDSGSKLNVTWQSPWNSQGETVKYKVTYKCMRLLACESVSCITFSGVMEVGTTTVVLGHLQPHALYQIELTAVSADGHTSEIYVINATTVHTAPRVAPTAAENQILGVTNISVLLSWKPPKNCPALNGYIYGYSYALFDNDTEEIIQQGTVPENILSVNISDLMPSHCYDAHIAVVASGGTSHSNKLVIPFCTSSTAPEKVQSLRVYKRGRRMVGLRWSLPINTYGAIESFTIRYSKEGSDHEKKLITEPKHCGAWINLYCHTISGLSPGKKYCFVVQARNKEVIVDGEPASVEAITAEGASTPPVNPRIINATENSMLLEWSLPDNVNGQLRSFIIIVEQIDTRGNSEECCDDIPLQDYRVTSEEPFYHYEITGLSAASTYSVTVSAKTVTLGEESRILGHTYPPKPSLPQKAIVLLETDDSSYESDTVTLQIQPVERINGINRTYILLHLTDASSMQQPFDDRELVALLQSRFIENYHLMSEYTQEELENQSVVTFSLKDLGLESTERKSQKYALILIQDYMGNRNMDIFVTQETRA